MSEGGTVAVCALCGTKAKLEKSHLIPRFVYRALQVPDGPTRPLLCGECEDLFSRHESTFARVVFHPLVANSRVVAKYDKWLLQFAASVCWRVLEEHLTANQAIPSESRSAAQLISCRETWRLFLTGKRSDVGDHPIHLLVSDRTAEADAVEMAVRHSDDASHVYAQLGSVI